MTYTSSAEQDQFNDLQSHWWRMNRTTLLHNTYLVTATLAMAFLLAAGLSSKASSMQSDPWTQLSACFDPPAQYAGHLGTFRSPLLFKDRKPVKDAAGLRR